MHLEFDNEPLKNKLCGPAGPQGYYPALSRSITNRLSELRAAKNLGDIPVSPPPKLQLISGEDNRWAVSLHEKHTLVLEALFSTTGGFLNSSLTDATSITSVRILGIREN